MLREKIKFVLLSLCQDKPSYLLPKSFTVSVSTLVTLLHFRCSKCKTKWFN